MLIPLNSKKEYVKLWTCYKLYKLIPLNPKPFMNCFQMK